MILLIPRSKADVHCSFRFETPFFAVYRVSESLLRPDDLPGLHELIQECGFSPHECLFEYAKNIILKKSVMVLVASVFRANQSVQA